MEQMPPKESAVSVMPTAKMKRRLNSVILIILMIVALAVICGIFKISVLNNKKYETLANNYHFGTMKIEAKRGAIYDTNGTPLAWSATVYNVYIDPTQFRSDMDSIETSNEKKKSTAEESGEQAADLVDVEALKKTISQYLASELDIPAEDVTKGFEAEGRYYVLKKQVEKDTADAILEYFDDLNLTCISTESTTKRYYPQNELAASVIGFTNGDGDGQYGLEYQYQENLAGVDGRVISAQAANGEEMPYRYSTTYDAEDGDSLYLTLNITLQYYLEKSMAEMVSKFEVANRACGIIMNAKTGAIYAMATAPSFDLNNPSEIFDEKTAASLKTLSGSAYTEAYTAAREQQWKNKAVTELYYPGSVFKVITSAAAFEEKLIHLDTDSFYCQGYTKVADREIGCSNRSGHGAQTFTQALTNSCNPAFMEIGARLGIPKFCYYFAGFGLTERTGIDLPGESNSLYVHEENMSDVDLATSSFGYANKITPLQMITAYAAAINGGNLVQPYMVEKIVSSDGNVVKEHETTVRRQVVSEETSQTMREQLEAVVNNNKDHNAYIEGYRIGGKSGTSEKLDEYDEDHMQYVASYCCFAPADDPDIIMLIMADEPNKEIGYYGSAVTVDYARTVMKEILPELGYYPSYSEEEGSSRNVTIPLVQAADVSSAQATMQALGLTCEVVGSGDTVLAQCPTTGSTVAPGGKVILYTEAGYTAETVTVPNLIGLSPADANAALTNLGLNYAAIGASADSEGATVQSQSIAADTTVDRGTSIVLTLSVTPSE